MFTAPLQTHMADEVSLSTGNGSTGGGVLGRVLFPNQGTSVGHYCSFIYLCAVCLFLLPSPSPRAARISSQCLNTYKLAWGTMRRSNCCLLFFWQWVFHQQHLSFPQRFGADLESIPLLITSVRTVAFLVSGWWASGHMTKLVTLATHACKAARGKQAPSLLF